MRTLLINTSPKKWKRLSNSNYLLTLAALPVKGTKVKMDYMGAKDIPLLKRELLQIDALVLAMPVYVDAVPSHVLELMQIIEAFAKENHLKFRVYAICNCGFYEGIHCETEMNIIRNFCARAGLEYSGGGGVGGGEMFGFIRFNPLLGLIITVIEFVIRFGLELAKGNVTGTAALHCIDYYTLPICVLVTAFFSILPYMAMYRLGKSISGQNFHGDRFTSLSFRGGSPVFILFASLYWILRALFQNCIFVWTLFRRRINTGKSK